jgi:osmoprotectant transport system ATP-binding protein
VIRLEQVTKRYGRATAVDALDLEVERGELCVLVGPSGCGKTTTMKMINRIIEPTSGRILLDGEDVTHGDPVALRRKIGYVIQQIGLFPHQTVADNVGTVPRLLGWDRRRVAERVEELLTLVGLDPATFGPRYPSELSGGQRQRAGVARALGADPPVLLMDEPFGAIDPITRDRLQNEFLRLQEEVRKTIVFVTHDIEEAVKLGDRIAILAEGGVLEQHDTPAEVLGNPANEFVADFVGADRGLKRMKVTAIDVGDLEQPPLVRTGTPLDTVRASLDAVGAAYALVVDEHRGLRGWISRARAGGDGTAADRSRPVEAVVSADGTLKDAFSEMLLYDSSWVAVLDEGRLLGVLTPDALHAAMRRSISGAGSSVDRTIDTTFDQA